MILPLLLSLLCLTAPPAHDYHVSKTNVRYVAERQQVQVEMHLFADDLELALREAGSHRLYLGTEREDKQARTMLTNYLDKHFLIDWNGERLATELLGWELDDDLHGLWIYLAAPATEAPTKVAIEQTAITEVYADQRNIVKLFEGDRRRATLLLSRDRPRESYGR